MINIVLLLTMEISFILFIISHPKSLNNSLGQYIRNHSLLTKQNFFVWKRNTDVGFACSFGLQFHLFWCSVAFHRFPTLSHATQDGGGGNFYATQETGG